MRLASVVLSGALTATGCAQAENSADPIDDIDGPSKAIDEDGAWLLLEADLPGNRDLRRIDDSRRDGFMIKFDEVSGFIAVASCQDSDEAAEGVPGSLTSSLCAQSGVPEQWHCECFSYSYERDDMCWSDEMDTEPELRNCGGKHETKVSVETIDGINATMVVSPLPKGVFDSGGSSRYLFEQKSPTVFDATGCSDICGLHN